MRKCFFIFFLFITTLGFTQDLDQFINELKNLPDSNQVDSMIRFARKSAIDDQGELGIQQALWALDKAQQNSYTDLIPKARYYLARNFFEKGELDSAIHYYQQTLIEAEGTKVESWKLFAANALGGTYRQNGEFEKAIKTQLNTIKEYENELDSSELAELYSEVGYSYDRMKEFQTAIDYQRKALQLIADKDEFYKQFIYSRIAIAHDDLKHYDSAHFYNFNVLRYSISIGDSTGTGIVASNIGNTYLKQEKWEEAHRFLKRATRLNLQHGDQGNLAISFLNLGNVQTKLKRYNDSKKSLNTGIAYAKAWNNKKFLSEGYFLKSKLYESTTQLDSSLYYFKKFKTVEDSLYDLEKMNQIKRISAQFETEKKEQQIALQEANLAQKESKIKANQRTILALIVLSFLILVIAFAAYKRYQAKKNAEVQQKVIEEQEKGLKAVFNAQENERKRISRELHDGIGQQLSGLKMAIQAYGNQLKGDEKEKSTIEKLAKIASESADEVRSISHQMMPRSLTELGLIAALENMLSQSLAVNNIQYEFEQHQLEERLPESIEVSLYRICQELVSNIIKHAKATHVNIQLFKNAGKIILIIEDNGLGMKNESKDGHGLLNIKSRLNTVSGEVSFAPSPNSGTLATIRIPL